MESVQGQRRLRFQVTNLSLDAPLVFRGFELNPYEEGQREYRKLSSLYGQHIITAEGVVIIKRIDVDDPWRKAIKSVPLLQVELLLSFAHRRLVSLFDPILEECDGTTWIYIAGKIPIRPFGRVKGPAIFGWEGGLAGFMERTLPILANRELNDRSGLLQAFRFFCSNYGEDYAEPKYLKTWTAFEILYSKYSSDENVLNDRQASRMRQEFRNALEVLEAQKVIDDEQKERVEEKFPELRRLSARRQAASYLAHVFHDYPVQSVTDDELKKFSNIRNEITHTGIMRLDDPNADYSREIWNHHRMLRSLLERVFLSMLGERVNLMNIDWKNGRVAS